MVSETQASGRPGGLGTGRGGGRGNRAGPHHEAKVSPLGGQVAPDLIVQLYVLIDEVHILFMWQEVCVQSRTQQEEPQLHDPAWPPGVRVGGPVGTEGPGGLHGVPAAGGPVRRRSPAPVTCQSLGRKGELGTRPPRKRQWGRGL